MNAQLKYSYKKEGAQFTRKLKLLGIILAIFGFALMTPLLFKFISVVLNGMSDMDLPGIEAPEMQAEFQLTSGEGAVGSDSLGGMGFGEVTDAYNSARTMFAMTLAEMVSYSLLIIMIVMMKPAGGEQKKRAMIVPLCCGLEYRNYLIPKFIIYPLSVFGFAFLGGLTAGSLCNSMFENDILSVGQVALASFMLGIYMAFVITVYLALGLCTSHAGAMVAVVFVGELFLPSLVSAMGLSSYQPFALVNLIGALSDPSLGDILSDNLTNILVSSAISIAIGVLMFFITLAVLNGKRVDNQQEDKPEF